MKKNTEEYREKERLRSKEYREKNKEEIKEYKKEYDKNHKVEKEEYSKEYNQRPEVKERINILKRKRRKDPIIRLNNNISRGIGNSLNLKGLSKAGRHWEDLIGYTLKELKEHLESLFIDGMSWGNHGMFGWHIDHIVPISFFEYTSTDDVEFKYAWSLDNLQPLWAKDNWSKGNKIK